MNEKELWQLFCETGEPLCYLMLRSAEKERKQVPKASQTTDLAQTKDLNEISFSL